MDFPPPITRRGGTFMSRMLTSLLALALSNVLFYLWQIGFISTFGLSLNVLAYVAQAVGSSVGACLDYFGHAHVYHQSDSAVRLPRQWQFYVRRIVFLPVGLATFILTYEWWGLPYVLSSCLSSAVGWAAGYTSIEKLFQKS